MRGLGGSRTDLSTSIGRLAQFKWLKGRAKSDVYMLGEVNVVDSMMGQWTKEWGGQCLWCPGGTHGNGTAILIHPKSQLVMKPDTQHRPSGLLDGRVVMVCIEVNGELISITSVYAPSQPKQRGAFMKLLDEELHTYNTLHNTTGQNALVRSNTLLLKAGHDCRRLKLPQNTKHWSC